MKNVLTRAISGTVYVAAMIGAVLAGGGWLAAILILLGVIGTTEIITMTSDDGKSHRVCSLIDIVVTVSIILAGYFSGVNDGRMFSLFMLLILCGCICRLIAQLYAVGNNAIKALGSSAFNYLYIGVGLGVVPLIYYSFGAHLVLAILIFVWVNDTGAFCVGSRIGRHKLFERISPKKSIEGFIGGMVFVVIAAVILSELFSQYYGFFGCGRWICLGIFVSIMATYGDLIESLIKRTAGVKDSGTIIPGHGGVLDRIDSLLLVFPSVIVFIFL